MNKLNKQLLEKMIREEISEAQMAAASASELTKGMKSSEATKEVRALTTRERSILGALQQVQKALSQKGEQTNSKVVRLVQMMLDELGSATPNTGEPQ